MNFELQIYLTYHVLLSMFLGGVVGLEREFSKKAAGLRTHMIVAGAATLLVILSESLINVIPQYNTNPGVISRFDPIRIIEAIVTGLSFIGAGTIIRNTSDKRGLEGLTTAASMLFTGGIGIAVAVDMIYLAVSCTLLVLIVNFGVGKIEDWFKLKQRL